MCGATDIEEIVGDAITGLSPRVWGNPRRIVRKSSYTRSIPTCVGQPRFYAIRTYLLKVYPHVCGATDTRALKDDLNVGLSPRVWGNHIRRYGSMHGSGSIPTCVGQPEIIRVRNFPRRVYPHVCGATGAFPRSSSSGKGLSPRVWGNPWTGTGKRLTSRSIPTCVGQPLNIRLDKSKMPVYPHVCGATVVFSSRLRYSAGLSPRVWGNHPLVAGRA